jgi:hypothetical protein
MNVTNDVLGQPQSSVFRLVLLAVLLFCTTPAFAQNTPHAPNDAIPARGTEIVQSLLKYHGLKPISVNDFLGSRTSAAETLVVLVGRLPRENDKVASAIYNWHLADGGALFIASDQPANFGHLIPGASGMGIDNNRVICTSPNEVYANDPSRPYAKLTSVPGFPTVKLATDSPSLLMTVFRSRFLNRTIATHPSPLFSTRDGDQVALGKEVVFGMRSDPDLGCRIYAFANRAIIENRMMVLDDSKHVTPPGMPASGNFLASFFITHDLANGGAKRTKCLFLEDGQAVMNFDRVSLQAGTPPIPPVQPPIPLKRILDLLAEKMNEQIDKQERKYGPDDYFAKQEDNKGRRRWLQWLVPLAIGAVLAPGIVLLVRGWRTRKSTVESPRISFADAAALPPTDGLMSRRRWDVMDTGGVTEPMREYVRALFEGWGVPSGYAGPMPTFTLTGGNKRFGRAMLVGIEKLWRIAYEHETVSADAHDLVELEATVKTVGDAAAANAWTLTLPNDRAS